MIKYALKLLVFFSLLLLFDKLFLIVADLSAKAEVDKRLEYLLMGEMNKDIIVFGSSTGSRDIIASQIEKETGFSSYNLCYPGSDVTFHDFILQTLLEFNKKPKILVLVVDDNAELRYDETIMFRKDRLYPLVKYSYIWKELAKREGRSPFFSRFLVLDRLNKYNFDIRQKRFTPQDTIMSCGSMPISWKPEGKYFPYESGSDSYPIEEEMDEKVLAFKNIISNCEKNNIDIIIVHPPVYKSHSRAFENRIRELSGNGCTYYVYNMENPIYSDAEYYNDETHLMRKGAEVFTRELSAFLKTLLVEADSISFHQ